MEREDIELELLSVKEQMHKVESSDSNVKRSVMEFLLISPHVFEVCHLKSSLDIVSICTQVSGRKREEP